MPEKCDDCRLVSIISVNIEYLRDLKWLIIKCLNRKYMLCAKQKRQLNSRNANPNRLP